MIFKSYEWQKYDDTFLFLLLLLLPQIISSQA